MLAAATQRLEQDERRTVLFLDEIHRFTKAQQDALLPGVEDGTVILVGATTENPFFEVNSPLISRSTPVSARGARAGRGGGTGRSRLRRRARDQPSHPAIIAEARALLGERCGGDARLALNALEVAALIAAGRGSAVVDVADGRRGAAAADHPLRPGRRPALRRDLGLHQERARVGSRRRRLLAPGDAGGR